MRQTWRWFGPVDKVTLADARQAGVEGIVTALHHVATGAVWTPEEIEKRQREVAFHPDGAMTHLAWEVVESLPVSEAIKTQTGEWRAHIVHYRRSLENLARAGIPVDLLQFHAGARLDAHRARLAGRAWRPRHALRPRRFRRLRHPHAEAQGCAARLFGGGRGGGREALAKHGRRAGNRSLPPTSSPACRGRRSTGRSTALSAHLATYDEIGPERLRQNLIDFLSEVAPHAEKLGAAALLPSRRSAVPAARAAAHHVDAGRLPRRARCRRRSRQRRRRSAPARSARGRTTTCRRW